MGFIMARYVFSNGTPHLQPLFKYHDNQGNADFKRTILLWLLWMLMNCYKDIYIYKQNKYSSKWDFFWLALLNLCQWNHDLVIGRWMMLINIIFLGMFYLIRWSNSPSIPGPSTLMEQFLSIAFKGFLNLRRHWNGLFTSTEEEETYKRIQSIHLGIL